MSKDVKFNIKLLVDGREQVVQASADVKELAKHASQLKKQMSTPRDFVLGLAGMSTVVTNVAAGVQQLAGVMREYTQAAAMQREAETQLANNMRNTMDATEEDIQAIKDLCSAQQQLGVIGDEVQLAGAQELATYLEQRTTLEGLIPVMNDMIAQQYGLNATQESAVTIATMLGKVMNGQVTALKRLGYSFDDAQERVLKYGTETERMVVLADVVSQSVGGMNAELAKTDAGKAKQAANDFGDWKEEVGKVVAKHGQLIEVAGSLSMVIAGLIPVVTMTYKSVVALGSGMVTLATNEKVVAAATAAGSAAMRTLRNVIAATMITIKSAKTATQQLSLAIKGLLISSGVGIAIWALTEAVGALMEALGKAEDSEKELNEADETYQSTLARGRQTLDEHKERLRKVIAANEDGTAAVAAFNKEYAATFGTMNTAAKAYDTLIRKGEDFCKQQALMAKQSVLTSEAYDLAAQKMIIAEKKKKLETEGKAKTIMPSINYATDEVTYYEKATPEYQKLLKEEQDLNDKIKTNKENLAATNAAADALAKSLGNMGEAGKTAVKDMTLGEVQAALLANKEAALTTAVSDTKRIAELKKERKELEAREKVLKKLFGLETKTGKTKKTGDPMKGKYYSDPKTAEELDHNIQLGTHKLTTEQTAENLALLENIKLWKKKKEAIDKMLEVRQPAWQTRGLYDTLLEGMNDPKAYKNIDDVRRKIALLEEAWGKTTDDAGARAIDEQITKFKELASEMENARRARVKTGLDEVKTVEEIDAAINQLREDEAKQSADQITATERQIAALERKKKALTLGSDIVAMQREVSEMQGLSGKEFTVKVRGMGFEQLTEKIREIQRMLADTENPVTDKQREQLQALLNTYEQWRKKSVDVFATLRGGVEDVLSVGDTVKSLTQTLKGDGDAWEKTTAVIRAALSVYDTVQSVMGIVTMLSQAFSTTKAVEGVTEQTVAGTKTAAVAEETAANIELVASNEAAKVSYLELAAAAFFAAHASIPFAGADIASAFVAQMTATVESMKMMALAEGGLAYGPTTALIGEYQGARSNPEVVAPLNKLRDMIGGSPMDGQVEFKIDGTTLRGVLRKVDRRSARS